jgi:hypothetical protein
METGGAHGAVESDMDPKQINDTDPARLAELLQISDGNDRLWRPEELGHILRHQLAAPVEFDLGALGRGPARRLRSLAGAQGLLLKSFGELLEHASPPVELLEMTKRFAKAHCHQPDSPVPREIATLLYYASIAAALVRCRKRISALDDAALRDGFAWSRQQAWVDERLLRLFDEGLELLKA